MQISDAYENMIYGYARVSTAAQDERGQVKQLKAAGCGKNIPREDHRHHVRPAAARQADETACARRRGDHLGR